MPLLLPLLAAGILGGVSVAAVAARGRQAAKDAAQGPNWTSGHELVDFVEPGITSVPAPVYQGIHNAVHNVVDPIAPKDDAGSWEPDPTDPRHGYHPLGKGAHSATGLSVFFPIAEGKVHALMEAIAAANLPVLEVVAHPDGVQVVAHPAGLKGVGRYVDLSGGVQVDTSGDAVPDVDLGDPGDDDVQVVGETAPDGADDVQVVGGGGDDDDVQVVGAGGDDDDVQVVA